LYFALERDRLGNLTILTRSDNEHLGDTEPDKYLCHNNERLAHFIPDDPGVWSIDKFKQFCERKAARIVDQGSPWSLWGKVRWRCGCRQYPIAFPDGLMQALGIAWNFGSLGGSYQGRTRGSARNADKGGEWRKRREMVKTLNQVRREQRDALRKRGSA
jgi:hypothetical protein